MRESGLLTCFMKAFIVTVTMLLIVSLWVQLGKTTTWVHPTTGTCSPVSSKPTECFFKTTVKRDDDGVLLVLVLLLLSFLKITSLKKALKQTKGDLKQTEGALKQTKGALKQTEEALKETKGALKQTKGALKQTEGTLLIILKGHTKDIVELEHQLKDMATTHEENTTWLTNQNDKLRISLDELQKQLLDAATEHKENIAILEERLKSQHQRDITVLERYEQRIATMKVDLEQANKTIATMKQQQQTQTEENEDEDTGDNATIFSVDDNDDGGNQTFFDAHESEPEGDE